MKDETMTVLVVKPMTQPFVQTIPNTLEAMQKLVGGDIEAVYPFDDPVALIYRDEGKLLGLLPNRFLRDKSGAPYDYICGTFFVAEVGEEEFMSLSPDLMEKYDAMYRAEALMKLPKQKENHEHER